MDATKHPARALKAGGPAGGTFGADRHTFSTETIAPGMIHFFPSGAPNPSLARRLANSSSVSSDEKVWSS